MSRSKRKKKTILCACGERLVKSPSNKASHDMCFNKKEESRNNLRAILLKQIEDEKEKSMANLAEKMRLEREYK